MVVWPSKLRLGRESKEDQGPRVDSLLPGYSGLCETLDGERKRERGRERMRESREAGRKEGESGNGGQHPAPGYAGL